MFYSKKVGLTRWTYDSWSEWPPDPGTKPVARNSERDGGPRRRRRPSGRGARGGRGWRRSGCGLAGGGGGGRGWHGWPRRPPQAPAGARPSTGRPPGPQCLCKSLRPVTGAAQSADGRAQVCAHGTRLGSSSSAPSRRRSETRYLERMGATRSRRQHFFTIIIHNIHTLLPSTALLASDPCRSRKGGCTLRATKRRRSLCGACPLTDLSSRSP